MSFPEPAVLLREVATPWGIYMPNQPVLVTEVDSRGIYTVCMDNGFHPAGICHDMGLAPDEVRITNPGKHAAPAGGSSRERTRLGYTVRTTDTLVRGHRGTVARCSCGWYAQWEERDGSAEKDAEAHLTVHYNNRRTGA